MGSRASCKATFDNQYREPCCRRRQPAAAAASPAAAQQPCTLSPAADAVDIIERKRDAKTGKLRYYVHYLECEIIVCAAKLRRCR